MKPVSRLLAYISTVRTPTLLAALFVAIFLIYWPGLYGDFIFDDFINIVNNANSHLTTLSPTDIFKAFFSGVSSSISRPLTMLSFGLNHYFTGLNPFAYKLTNLFVHVITSFGIYLLSRQLLEIGPNANPADKRSNQLLACFITACWALHPLNVSSVLYVVQRMNQLSALTIVYSLVFYCNIRRNGTLTSSQAAIAFGALSVLMLIGVLFKENAVLLAPFILVLEICFFNFRTSSVGQQLLLRLYFCLFLALPCIVALVLFFSRPNKLSDVTSSAITRCGKGWSPKREFFGSTLPGWQCRIHESSRSITTTMSLQKV